MSSGLQLDVCHHVGETQMTKFSSNRPVKSTLTADQSLLKRALSAVQVHMVEPSSQVQFDYGTLC